MYQKVAEPNHRRSPGRWHWTALLIILVFLIATFWVSSRQIGMVDQQFRSILMDQVSSIAHTINPERVAALTFDPKDRMNPSFRRLNHQFRTCMTSLDCRGIYTMFMRDGRILFGPESYAEEDPMASPPGTVYLHPTAAVSALFENPREFVEGPYEDEYGTFVSAYAPVMDPATGELLLVVGMDVELSAWKSMIRSEVLREFLHGSVMAVVLLGGAWVLWLRQRMNLRWRRLLHLGEVYYAALVGLLLTAVTAEFLHDMEVRSRYSVFMEVTHSHINQVVSAFNDFRDHRLGAVARFCENSMHVDPEEFEGFTNKILENRGIEGLFWVPAVPMDERDNFLKNARSEGPPDYQIRDANRSEEDLAIENLPMMYPVRYAEPFDRWKHLLGYDMYSSEAIHPYIEKSMEGGLPISMPIQMRSGVSNEGKTIQIIYPVFREDLPDRPAMGFIVATLELQPFLQAVLASGQQIADNDVISCFLLDSEKEPELVASSEGMAPGSVPNTEAIDLHRTRGDDLKVISPLFAFGDTYALVAQPGFRFLHEHPLRARWISWLMGVLITGLVTMFVGFITRHRIQLENQVQQRTIELQEREKFLAATLRSIGDGVISTDPLGMVTGINVVAENLTGWFAPEAIGMPVAEIFQIIHSRTRGPAADPVQIVLKTRQTYELANHTALIARDGTESQIADSCAPILSLNGQIEGAVLVFRDVTKEYARREELRRIRKAVDSSSDAIGICDAKGNHFYQNDTFTKLFGYTIEEVRELTPKALYVDHQIADAVFTQIMGGGSWSGELEMVAKDGRHFEILLRADAVRDEGGKTVSLLGIHTDITDQKKAREALMKSREQYMLAANGSHDGMWDWDLISNNLFLSPRWKQMIGYRDNELPGSFETFADHLHPEDKPVVMDYVKRYLNAEFERYSIEFRFRHRNGSYRWILARGEALRDEKGIPYRMAGSHTDITERKEAEEELRKTNTKLQKAISRAEELAEQAARANAAKSDFLANVSHEIRTPMNGVIGMTRMLLDSTLSPDQKHYADLAYSSAKALLGIIDDILDFSKIEAGKLTLESSDFDLLNTLENVTELLTIKAEEKRLEIVSILDSNVPSRVHGDPGRIRQVLLNLGGNAVKFTHSGRVTIHGSLDNQTADRLTIRFTVTDTGIGIPPDKHEMLFNPFTQVDQSARRKYGGTGLGLAISRQLVEAMGGGIEFKSSEGTGSEFQFTVILKTVQTPDRLNGDKVDYEFPEMQIMVVDENPAIHLQIRMLLNHPQEKFEGVGSGASAFDRLNSAVQEGVRFDVILVNRTLPDMDIVQFSEKLEATPGYAGIGLIVLTPMGLSKAGGWLPEIAVGGFLKKPVRKSTLRRCLSDMLVRSQSPEGSSDSIVSAGNGSAGPVPVFEGTRILLVEDHPVNLIVTRKMLERLGCKTDAAENGLRAIEALKERQFDLVLMDCQMPEMDGFEATRMIRDPASGVMDSSIPIVAMTAHAGAADREKCMAAGMSDYLSKPVESADLAAMIKRFIANR